MFGVVLDCVWVRIIKKQEAPFLPGTPHVADVHKAAFRFRWDNQSKVAAYQPFGHTAMRRNYFPRGENGKKSILNARDAIEQACGLRTEPRVILGAVTEAIESERSPFIIRRNTILIRGDVLEQWQRLAML
jgi:hypothetical protein